MKIKKSICSLMSAVLCMSMLTTTVIAVDTNTEVVSSADNVDSDLLIGGTSSDANLITTQVFEGNYEATKQVNVNARANWNLGDTEIFALTESLTSDDTDDMFIWSLDSPASVALELTSNNSNYIAAFYSLDMSTGVATWLDFYDLANDTNPSYNVNMAAGDYAIFVYSLDSNYDTEYNLMLNASNPSGASHIVAKTDNLSKIIFYYNSTQKVYNNGVCANPDNLYWNRRWVLNYGGGRYDARQCIVGSETSQQVFTKGIYYGSYSSDYAGNIPNALIIELDENSLFHIARTTATGSSISINNVDYLGLVTPRRLIDGIDITNSRAHYLVINLENNQVVDFASIANVFYSLGWQESYTLPSDFIIYYQK